MIGSVLITGANGSLAIHAVDHLLRHYPEYAAVLTVRNADDANSKRLREIISKYPNAKTFIYQLDLADLSAVHDFSSRIEKEIAGNSYPPLSAIIANAYYWNLVSDPELTKDGYEKTFQIGHIAHVALVLRLLGSFGPEGGKVVLFSSDAHWPGKNSLEKYPPSVPNDLELLVKADAGADKTGLGFQRYANTKLATVAWSYALERHLKRDPSLNKITTVAINPGNLIDSRALRVNTPKPFTYMQKFVLRPLLPLIRLKDHTARLSAAAGVDVIELAVNPKYVGQAGYYTLLEKDESSPESREEQRQKALWVKSLTWAGISKENTVLAVDSLYNPNA
ncbi:NAD(P)-binding protein [Daldinia sp. FL1419]|nr:NAD(P)-binding protein [Daldinia sp. FL1419]